MIEQSCLPNTRATYHFWVKRFYRHCRIATTPLQQFVIDLRSELDRRQPEDVYA